MEQMLYIVRYGDSYERFIVGVGASAAEAVRIADDHCAQRSEFDVGDGHYGYLVVPMGRVVDWEGLETPIYDEEPAA
jgi:hypothetical protein